MAHIIRAELAGSRRCSALGLTIQSYAPVCVLARKLIAAGFSPDRLLEVYRGPTLCFRVPLAKAARLTVTERDRGGIHFERWKPLPSSAGSAPTARTGPVHAEGHRGAQDRASVEVVR
jgi:hypothetical protein